MRLMLSTEGVVAGKVQDTIFEREAYMRGANCPLQDNHVLRILTRPSMTDWAIWGVMFGVVV